MVVRARTESLWDRLVAHGYAPDKVEGNIDARVMEALLQEAREAFDERVVVELWSDGVEELDGNVERLMAWVGIMRAGMIGRARGMGKVNGEKRE